MNTLQRAIRFPSAFSSLRDRSRRRSSSRPRSRACVLEILEERQLLSTFTVTSLDDSGTGSLRQAIIDANAAPGPDGIVFGVAGTIRVQGGGLPTITDPLALYGNSAPTFAGSPVVTLDFQGNPGLHLAESAVGSFVGSLSIVHAGNAGITLDAAYTTIQGNYIGVLADGSTAAGNQGDGIQVNASAHDDQIGHADPVTSIDYYNADSASMQPVSGWQGIRASNTSGQYVITGTSGSNGLLYEGPINGVGGTSYAVNVPGSIASSVYGPDVLDAGVLRLVGTYRTGNDVVQGFYFQGTTGDLSNASNYTTVDYPGAQYTYVHSTMGGLAVGNADGPEGNLPIGTGHAFLYAVEHDAFLGDVVYPGSTSTTAYGVWYNGGTSYTIAGGYTALGSAGATVGHAYLVDYNSATGAFTHWTSFDYPNPGLGQDLATHFEGISSAEKGVYTLSADSAESGSTNPVQGSWVTVRRNTDGSFGPGVWQDLNYPGVDPSTHITSANSVAGNQVVGIVISGSGSFSYQLSVNTTFQLSNVISANGGNGIGIYGSNRNRIAMNNIGTDATGALRLGNARNGILVTAGASGNMIGGQSTDGNDPTGGVFVRPPQGNLISGNVGDGVLINQGATTNTLSGNFIGTAASGDSPIGNLGDGVAIVNANGNQLIGCTFQQDPFVFYNVISGNGGNGLRITDSNDTVVQANFLGVGANNAALVANLGDGLLVSGTSSNTQVGGVIPLGNVISGNFGNGIEVKDQASGFISFNTFAGLYAFSGPAPNRRNGILITSTGGNNLIRTSVVSGNLGNGIVIGGNATGVQVSEVAVGTTTDIKAPMPNGLSGIVITDQAHGNTIGGFQPSIIPQTTVSANQNYGIEVVGRAHDNQIVHTYVGTNFDGTMPMGNILGGILLGPGTRGTTIGGTDPSQLNKIANSGGNGVTILSSRQNAVVGDEIMNNQGFGVYAQGVCTGTVIRGDWIANNAAGDVNLARSRGVKFGLTTVAPARNRRPFSSYLQRIMARR